MDQAAFIRLLYIEQASKRVNGSFQVHIHLLQNSTSVNSAILFDPKLYNNQNSNHFWCKISRDLLKMVIEP